MKKSEKFEVLAKKRMDKLLHTLKLVANLSNKQYYSYTDNQKDQIINAIKSEFDLLKSRFDANSSDVKEEKGFRFK